MLPRVVCVEEAVDYVPQKMFRLLIDGGCLGFRLAVAHNQHPQQCWAKNKAMVHILAQKSDEGDAINWEWVPYCTSGLLEAVVLVACGT